MPLTGHHRHYFTIQQRETLQRELEAALARLHEPDFGLCVDCDAEIPYARLSANPTATRCVTCQAQHERGAGPAPGL
jgi:phage/conjugal plasmid C-4 type zinc finger TraR family protein